MDETLQWMITELGEEIQSEEIEDRELIIKQTRLIALMEAYIMFLEDNVDALSLMPIDLN